MSKAACKVEEDGAMLNRLGTLGRQEPSIGKFLEQPGPKEQIKRIAASCMKLNEMVSAELLK